MDFQHKPVLFAETINSLAVSPDGIYVDCTAGGGGHSSAILSSLKNGRLIAIDTDPDAVETLYSRFGSDSRVTVVHDNFRNISKILEKLEIDAVQGVLADLGVSSHQLDTAERGFSFHTDAPLDMRMSQSGVTAAQLVNTLPEGEIRRIIYQYGEDSFAPRIAAAIVRARENGEIKTTLELAEIIKAAVPAAARREGHPARKTFQALRIEVNDELNMLDGAICDMFNSLTGGGRLAIISFHSLEDRIIKKRFARFCEGCTCPPDFPICVCGKKPQAKTCFKAKTPSSDELKENPRSRSAKLRAVEKI